MGSIRARYSNSFFRWYLGYTALETDLLFFIVYDAMFLTEVKGLSVAAVSWLTFLSLGFSLIIQYPLLKWINRVGNKTAVITGSVCFVLSSACITFAPGFIVVLIGGFIKCIAHTLSAIGTAVLKRKLVSEYKEDMYVTYQSDASGITSIVMMITSLLCGSLFEINAYLPMFACMGLSSAGVVCAVFITRGDTSSNEICIRNLEKKRRRASMSSFGILLLISFAMFTAITGTGLTYARLNFQTLLNDHEPGHIIWLLGLISSLVYLFRFLSNILMSRTYSTFKDRAAVLVSIMLTAGLILQILPWITGNTGKRAIMIAGYFMIAFARDPFITLVQNISLKVDEVEAQQGSLVALNTAKKAGALFLSAVGSLLTKWGIVYVMLLMLCISLANIFVCNSAISRQQAK
ncbi:MAG: hypothetical protein ILA15_06105 [Clostridiales bacterium]|nr:hypothetical protein [Clostridiales bacterium]